MKFSNEIADEILFLGLSTNLKLPKGLSDVQKLNFYANCQSFLISTASKIMERSPLKYSLTRGLSSLKPSTVLNSSSVASQRFDLCLMELLKGNRISSTAAERAKVEYRTMADSPDIHIGLQSFRETEDRLDTFWSGLIGKNTTYSNLWNCMKVRKAFVGKM